MPEFVFEQRLEKTPRVDTNIYKLKTPGFNQSLLMATAQRFKLKGTRAAGEIVSTNDEMSYHEGPFSITIGRRSGAMRFVDRTKFMVDDGETNIRMSDDTAIATAKEIISKFKLASLNDCKPLRVTRLRVGTLKKGANEAKERIIDVGVLFQRFVDGVPVYGSGGKIMVYLDKDKQLIGVDRVWRDISTITRPVPRLELQKPRYAEARLRRSFSRARSPRIEVKEMSFGYYEGGLCDVQRTLQPAYIMPVTLITPAGNMAMKTHYVVPAAQNPVGRIVPSKRPRPAERPRR